MNKSLKKYANEKESGRLMVWVLIQRILMYRKITSMIHILHIETLLMDGVLGETGGIKQF